MPACFPILARFLLWTTVAVVWLIVTPAVCAQLSVHAGFKAGIPGAGWYQNVSSREYARGSGLGFIGGPAIEFRFSRRFGIELGAIYRSVKVSRGGGYSFAGFTENERGRNWSFPLLGKYYFGDQRPIRPFAAAGVEAYRLSTASDGIQPVLTPTPGSFTTSYEPFHSTKTDAGAAPTAGGGVEATMGMLRFTAEARYARYPSREANDFLRRLNRNHYVFLAGISF